jgi:hypothetical protein
LSASAPAVRLDAELPSVAIESSFDARIAAHVSATRAWAVLSKAEKEALKFGGHKSAKYRAWERAEKKALDIMDSAFSDLCAAPAHDLAEARRKAEYLLTIDDELCRDDVVALLRSFLA